MTADATDIVPVLRGDFVRSDVGEECVVWPPSAAEPTALDALATVMLDVVDGHASVGQLATEIHEEIGIPLDTAHRRVREIIALFDRAGLLASSTDDTAAATAIAGRDLFIAASTPCSENASRLGTEALTLRFGERTVRIACDARRGARRLRSALTEHVVANDDDAPLAFVLTAPQGLQRRHSLVDRAGIVLSDGRGLDPGLRALASHLTAFLPPAPGTVRVRARAVVAGDQTIACLDPLLAAAGLRERDLAGANLRMIDRLALDLDVRTGRIVNPAIPWPDLDTLPAPPTHAGTGARTLGVAARAVCGIRADTPAAVVAQVAANGVHGSAADLVTAATALVHGAELRWVTPEQQPLVELLRALGTRRRDEPNAGDR